VRLIQRLRVTLRILLVDAPHRGGSAISTRLPVKRLISRASQDTFFKKTLQFERKYSIQGSRAPCHVSFGFFSPDFSGFSCQDFRWILSQSPRLKARRLFHVECGFCKSDLHISFGFKARQAFFEDLRRQGRLRLLEKTSRLLRHQLEYIPASGCFDYS
jgi:hypothetical protein